MTTYTDTQLKQALAKMLPENVYMTQDSIDLLWSNAVEYPKEIRNSPNDRRGAYVLDTELLHLCWLVEETLMSTLKQEADYIYLIDVSDIGNPIHATWQQRTIALCKVKGIEI
jgi:hypothetical protein